MEHSSCFLANLVKTETKRVLLKVIYQINICQYIVHRHPEFWDNPEKFDPDNFLPSKVNQRPKFAYFPFGAGQRICIGKSFALMEATIILASIFQRFRLELVPQQIELDPTFTLRPKYGVKVKVWKRS
ncbi:MAG: cytochrome P450 [Calothrix sp. FI2-JRJ7]|jgi:cytochrome P450|nr:cytochrome P450 [Calothrix sp. FI2-JRJ7]